MAITDNGSRRESEEEEDEISEDDSPRKDVQREFSRSARLNLYQPSSSSAMRSLNEQLSNLNDEDRKDLRIKGSIKRVNIAKQNDDEAVLPCLLQNSWR